jgi:glycosyltransferase involved in cell wall biosynthesis
MISPFAARACIVIPCFNEEARLDRDAYEQFLRTQGNRVELLFVNDGSSDNTLGLLREFERRHPTRVHVIDQQPNQGKAEAVRNGMQQALNTGADYVGYFDADLATPLEAVWDFVYALERNPDVDLVLGARVALLGRTIDRRASRHYLGRLFATAASVVLALPVYDTQCGAKLMRTGSRAADLFRRPFRSRWIFDVELIARYLTQTRRTNGIYELPLLTWRDVGESKVKPRDYLRAISEMAEIYRTYFLRERHDWLMRVWSAPLLRYFGAGGMGTTIHYLLLALLVEVGTVAPPVAAAAGSITGALVNYALNYHLTFASKAPHGRTMFKFMVVALLSALLNASGMSLLTSSFGVHYLAAQLACTAMVFGLGYLLNRAWTFAGDDARDKPDEASTPVDLATPAIEVVGAEK